MTKEASDLKKILSNLDAAHLTNPPIKSRPGDGERLSTPGMRSGWTSTPKISIPRTVSKSKIQ
jgi:hypothetical protein